MTTAPFARFAPSWREPTALRAAITAACRRPEPECLAPLLAEAALPAAEQAAAQATAARLVQALRARAPDGGVDELVQEFTLSSQEGVALMCLAEALLRIPDDDTRDALIRDKIAGADWAAHLGGGKSLFTNAATWGLVVTGKLLDSVNDRGLAAALTRLLARSGEPVIRRAVDLALRLMGEQFVTGETIAEALKRARTMERRGFTYSYDMLGEAAATAEDAARYYAAYEQAIHAIGKAARGRGVHAGPGISIKLSALHPRYARSQQDRVLDELLPRVAMLAALARDYDIGLNIDAEESDRLELSLDLLEALALDPALAGWHGLGFVVQAYGKRCPLVIDWLVDLARASGRRIMVRLVKGAYWDAEVKRAQVDGLADFPVYTRKVHTDVAYLACARRLLAARDAVYPQFATHNALTMASVLHMAGPDFAPGDYEFQCLHGMGEPLYEEVVGPGKLGRPCRIYAPVGTHETLLAYLVRRLLENGANSSFVNRVADPAVPLEELLADPVALVLAEPKPGAPHPAIALPADLYPDRRNSAGLDLASEEVLARLAEELGASVRVAWTAGDGSIVREVRNPANHADVVGTVRDATRDEARAVVARAATSEWPQVPPQERAALLERAADLLQDHMPVLLGLLVREAGKSVANGVAEVREAVDFLRYYAAQARTTLGPEHAPLGPVVCISPWNFPVAIFTGQVAAALAAGNPVVAKPAEETPLLAAEVVRLLHEGGIPHHALHLVCGAGEVGAALVGAAETSGVLFTGSTEVGRLIQRQLADRLSPWGQPIPLVAETGGQNAMVVDSSALAEQVVADVLASAFDSAGQRCSALRVLCLQDEVADRTLAMLRGAMAELRVGPTDRLANDVGPVISAEARDTIEAHVTALAKEGHRVDRLELGPDCAAGTFVAPTIIEISAIGELEREVFGPVLHVLRYRREDLGTLLSAIDAAGYGLTFGLHTRLDETVDFVTGRVRAGNIYVNRNVIGAVVGVQPFGGRGLSGTGPKAGGPLYLNRLLRNPPQVLAGGSAGPALAELADWLDRAGEGEAAVLARQAGGRSHLGVDLALPGPVGESNRYRLHPRGVVLLRPATRGGLFAQLAAVLATGNGFAVETSFAFADDLAAMSAPVRALQADSGPFAAVLVEGSRAAVIAAQQDMARRAGAIVPVFAPGEGALPYALDWLLEEQVVSTNTTAAGGNASLMTLA